MMFAKISTLIFFLPLFIFPFLSQPNPTNSQQPILNEIYPFIRVYKNGRIQRFIGQDFAPPSPTDPTAEVHSKDITFSQKYNLSARIYLPAQTTYKPRKIPLLIYFHGGRFFTGSAFSPSYNNHLNRLVAKASVLAVSVNYRLALENPLPIGTGPEPWLTKYADFGNVYMGGDSAGANIAHNMAIRSGWKTRAIGNETGDAYALNQMQRLWVYGYSKSKSGLDDPLVNPGMDPGLRRLGCKRVIVFVAGNDVLRFRVVEFGGENHVFNLGKPDSPKAIETLKLLAYFLNG
ncbi:hypothetical protein CASFOL_037344 [Castilleja foliolosa]|uniref:Alpha/beta hydrolase fold-3 domain-containing protein n=1 Tax=Castilleja foliolosa TaxID=1961234 RepID=A0ABD3BPA1_9LAMI